MSYPSVLSKPEVGDTLSLYLTVSQKALSSVLVREVDRVQHPVYYIGRALADTETRYVDAEKLALAP